MFTKPFRIIDIVHLEGGMTQYRVIVCYAQTRLFKAIDLDDLMRQLELYWASIKTFPHNKGRHSILKDKYKYIAIYPRKGEVPLMTNAAWS